MGHDSRAPGTNRTECTTDELRESDRRRAEAAAKKREEAVDRRRFAVAIQAIWRGYCVRDSLRQKHEQTAYLAVMFACMKIQRRFRNHLQLKAEREIGEREERQTLWALWVVQSVARCFGPQAELARRKAARAAEIRDLLMERSAIFIQKYWRGHLQRRLALWLRGADARRHLSSAIRVENQKPEHVRVEAKEATEAEIMWLDDDCGGGNGTLDHVSEAAAQAARRKQHLAAAAKARAAQAREARRRGS